MFKVGDRVKRKNHNYRHTEGCEVINLNNIFFTDRIMVRDYDMPMENSVGCFVETWVRVTDLVDDLDGYRDRQLNKLGI